jgi:uncharacterized radical SAM superfamily protein
MSAAHALWAIHQGRNFCSIEAHSCYRERILNPQICYENREQTLDAGMHGISKGRFSVLISAGSQFSYDGSQAAAREG